MLKADITFLGHSTVLIEMGGRRVLTDPVLFDRVYMLRRQVSPLSPELYRNIDVAIISHLHLDHLDFGSLRLLGPDTHVVVPRGAAALMVRKGIGNVSELAAGESTEIAGIGLTATHAVHSGFRPPFGPRAHAIGYLVDHDNERVYFAGDTDEFPGMRDLGEVDLALIPVWGWGPTLGKGHLDPDGAAHALTLIRPRAAVPIHWGTLWPLGFGRVRPGRLRKPAFEFARAAATAAPNVAVLLTPPGETVPIPR